MGMSTSGPIFIFSGCTPIHEASKWKSHSGGLTEYTTMNFSNAETTAAEQLIDQAIREDWGDAGDLTCNAVIPPDLTGEALFVSRSPGVVAGLPLASLILKRARGDAVFTPSLQDGAALEQGTVL